jgi:hypothetical protein
MEIRVTYGNFAQFLSDNKIKINILPCSIKTNEFFIRFLNFNK